MVWIFLVLMCTGKIAQANQPDWKDSIDLHGHTVSVRVYLHPGNAVLALSIKDLSRCDTLFWIKSELSQADALSQLDTAEVSMGSSANVLKKDEGMADLEIFRTGIIAKRILDSIPDYNSSSGVKKAATAIMNNSSFRIYTDVQGFAANQPNGLIQPEISWNWYINKSHILNRKNFFNHHWTGSSDTSTRITDKTHFMEILPLHNIQAPIFDLFQNKTADSIRYRVLNYDTTRTHGGSAAYPVRHIHTLDLVKYANLSVSFWLNLFELNFPSQGIKAFADLRGAYYRIGINDTLLPVPDRKYFISAMGFGFHLAIEVAPPAFKFSGRFSYSQEGISLIDNIIKQRYGPLYYPESNPLNNQYYPNTPHFGKKTNGVGCYQLEIFYNGKTNGENGSTATDGFFFRTSLYTNPIQKGYGLSYGNHYFQVQLGVVKSLEDLLKFLGMSKS